jgi:hypothetical protein
MHKNLEETNKNQLLEVQAQQNQDTVVNGTRTENVLFGHVEIAYAHNNQNNSLLIL